MRVLNLENFDMKVILSKGPSLKYVSIFKGGGVSEMLTLADMGGGGLFEMLTSANILHNHVYLH